MDAMWANCSGARTRWRGFRPEMLPTIENRQTTAGRRQGLTMPEPSVSSAHPTADFLIQPENLNARRLSCHSTHTGASKCLKRRPSPPSRARPAFSRLPRARQRLVCSPDPSPATSLRVRGGERLVVLAGQRRLVRAGKQAEGVARRGSDASHTVGCDRIVIVPVHLLLPRHALSRVARRL